MIRPAAASDLPFLTAHDAHIAPDELSRVVAAGRVLIAEPDGEPVGWLRWGMFWDSTPFMNLLYVLDGFRGQGVGRSLVMVWEEQLRQSGFSLAMTSTAADECAQHFYRRLGYCDVGGFIPSGEPYELIFIKQL